MFWHDEISPDSGPCKVLLKKGELEDPARGGRKVPYKIYYPDSANAGRFPVILWSHGFGGNRDGAAFLSRHLAAQGYILVHITHRGTDSSLWEGRKDAHPWDVLRNADIPREVTLARFQDVPFMIDTLEAWQKEGHDIARLMDLSRLGMSGHSFGALTTQVMAGQLFPDEDDTLRQFKEPRFTAGIVYSPVPIAHLTEGQDRDNVYGPIDRPLFHMTGTDDVSPLEGFGYERRLRIYEHTGHPEKYLLVKKGGDHMVYNGTRGKLKENPLRERHEDIIKVASHAFWDARLKNDENAQDWLCGGGLKTYIGEDAHVKTEMP